MGSAAGDVVARIHLSWWGQGAVEVSFYSQWKEIGAFRPTPE